jgi:hypothetical protein
MKRRFTAVLAVAAVTLTMTGTALAFDCMRVSSSRQGLLQSATHGGNWLFFDMTPGGDGVAEILSHFGVTVTPDQLACFQNAYTTAQAGNPALPTYFALGDGVAGGFNNGPGALAHNNPNTGVLSNGVGIDHFDDSVLPVFLAAAAPGGCLG